MPSRTSLGLPPLRSFVALNVILALAVAVTLAWYGYRVWLSYDPPSDYVDAYAEPSVVREGESLFIVLIIDRHRHCPTTLHRFILTTDVPPKLLWSGNVIGGITGLGVQSASHEIEAVRLLRPGSYVLRGAANPRCPEGEHYYFHKDIHFQVVPVS